MATDTIPLNPAWTPEQFRKGKRHAELVLSYPPHKFPPDLALERDAIMSELTSAVGSDEADAITSYFSQCIWEQREQAEAEAGAQAPKRKGLFRQARRVSKSPETWRSLSNYPLYEISSHGRVRSRDRVNPTDWLKPRRKWYRGMCVDYVVLNDREGRRCERMVGKLLIAAGFLEKPNWMKE